MNILITEEEKDYSLIDSGDGEKLEKYGEYILRRPDPQALWKRRLPNEEWKSAHGTFVRSEEKGEWRLGENVPAKWQIQFSGLKFWIKPTAFKHTGLFPEQMQNWSWLTDKIKNRLEKDKDKEIEILNLFAYTGGASLAMAKAGAKVVHVDSSKSAVSWASENADISDLGDRPIRWIIEDVRVFVEREIKRGRSYAGIIMDPPSFGHGPNSELWKIEEDFMDLLEKSLKLLSDNPLFVLINGYSAGYSCIAYENALMSLQKERGGSLEKGELAIKESSISGLDQRLLPSGIFARWSQEN